MFKPFTLVCIMSIMLCFLISDMDMRPAKDGSDEGGSAGSDSAGSGSAEEGSGKSGSDEEGSAGSGSGESGSAKGRSAKGDSAEGGSAEEGSAENAFAAAAKEAYHELDEVLGGMDEAISKLGEMFTGDSGKGSMNA